MAAKNIHPRNTTSPTIQVIFLNETFIGKIDKGGDL